MIHQSVTFIYSSDLSSANAFLEGKLGLERVLDQNGLCHIYRMSPTGFLGVCSTRPVPPEPGVTITLVVDDVDATHAAWAARGVVFDAPPQTSERFNVRSCFFRGIETYRFEVQTFLDPAWPRP
jgi:hypothetical protein